MAIERKVVTFAVSKAPKTSTFEDALAQAWDDAIAALPAGDWKVVNVEKRDGSNFKDSYVVWVENQV